MGSGPGCSLGADKAKGMTRAKGGGGEGLDEMPQRSLGD